MIKMKKIYKIIILVSVAAGLYLVLSHTYIYHRIHTAGLQATDTDHSYSFGASSSAETLVYASLGDSLTAGVGTDSYRESYPYLLAKDLAEDKNIVLENFSYPGARTEDLINNLLPEAVAAKPDIVTVLIGANDVQGFVSSSQFEKNYRHILDELTRKTKAKIYLISVPSVNFALFLPPYNYFFDWRVSRFNAIIKKLAGEYNVNFIDLNTPALESIKAERPYYAADLFHSSPYGYALWAKIIYANINH